MLCDWPFCPCGGGLPNLTYDDSAVVSQNRFVKKGFSGIIDILQTQYFAGYDPHINARAYRPVSLISYAIETELFGTDAKAHHVLSVLIYALTGILLSLGSGWLLTTFFFKITFAFSLVEMLIIGSGVIVLTILIGWYNSREVINTPPLQVLRKES